MSDLDAMSGLGITSGLGSGPKVKVGVIGAGAWGTALAMHTARMGHETLIWAREEQVVKDINEARENKIFLPGFSVPERLHASSDIAEVVRFADPLLLSVVPTPHVAGVIGGVIEHLDDRHLICSCSKGILNDTLETVDEILQRVLPRRFHSALCFLSGPSFAKEVAAAIPTAVTVASHIASVAVETQHLMSSSQFRFRCYASRDVVGVEMGGALKNVMAIATGAADGLGFGHNARAALITRGLAEITKLAVRKGANPLTLQGLAGMGDLVLTCTGDLSRNRQVGLRLGRGERLSDITGSAVTVAEGVLTTRSAWMLAEQLGVDVPIIENCYRVLYEDLPLLDALQNLMERPLGSELQLG